MKSLNRYEGFLEIKQSNFKVEQNWENAKMMKERSEKIVTEDDLIEESLIPWYVVSITAFLCATVMIVIAVLGPLGTGAIRYRTSQSGLWQLEGQDVANLVLIAPVLIIGGILHLMRRKNSKYFLILTPITLMYTGLSIGIGQEWNNPDYVGNIEKYSWLFFILVIGGLILLIACLSMFSKKDTPEFKPKGLRIYVAVMSIFLLLFAMMWISELLEVMSTGATSSGSYEATPTLWWVIRYLDLGFTIPLGFLALFLLMRRPKTSYPIVLLAFGFFVTTGTAVNAMAWIMFFNNDPELQPPSLVIFAVLGLLSYAGFLYLVKDKLKWPFARELE
jgi:hypothetical protein